MLEFRDIELSDRPWINELLKISDFMGCEYSFANNMAWRRLNDTKIARYKDFYISCSYTDKKPCFNFPAGKGDYKELFSVLKDYSYSLDSPLVISSVTPKCIPLFEELFGGDYEVESDPSSYDYIYNTLDLIELKGKKYHNKRNHLAKFNSLNWSFEPLTEKYYDSCIELSVNFYNDKKAYDDKSSVSEQYAIHTYFNNFKELELGGGVLLLDGKLIAFTIGERINSDTYAIHIEKAVSEINGSYAVINKEFAKYAAADFKFINREEDLGIEGLRKAKKSYYPAFLLEKSTIIFKG